MPFLHLPSRINPVHKPMKPVVPDYRNHFANDGLTVLWPMQNRRAFAGPGNPDDIGEYSAIMFEPYLVGTGTVPIWRGTRYGMGWLANSVSPGGNWGAYAYQGGTNSPGMIAMTVLIEFVSYYDGTVFDWGGGTFHRTTWSSGATKRVNLVGTPNAAGYQFRNRLYNATEACFVSDWYTASKVVRRKQTIIASTDGDGTSPSLKIKRWIDGVLDETDADTGSSPSDDGGPWIGIGYDSPNTWFSYYAEWNRELTEAEQFEIGSRPYQMLQVRPSATVYSFPSAVASTPGVQIFITK